MSAPPPVERDSRGILDPVVLRQRLRLTRFAAPAPLDGVLDRFWAVEWDLPAGAQHTQQVLTHPSANLSVGASKDGARIEARLNGVARLLTVRTMSGCGWAVAAMTRPGGLGVFLDRPAGTYTDRDVALGAALKTDDARLVAECVAAPDVPARVERLSAELTDVLERADPQRRQAALDVTGVARLAETDRDLRRVEELARAAGVSVRTLQRLFREHAGVSPTWVLRRYRLIEVAELVRAGESVVWADVAAALGFADQAHLVREFRAAVGTTPAAYAAAQRSAAAP